ADCDRRIGEIYEPPALERGAPEGARLGGDLVRDRGVIHVVAVGRDDSGALHTNAIGERAPRGATDLFLLHLAPARAPALAMTPPLQGRAGEPGALRAWRRDRIGKPSPPRTVVLTTGRALDLAHPLFRSEGRTIVVTGATGATALGGAARARGIEIVARMNH